MSFRVVLFAVLVVCVVGATAADDPPKPINPIGYPKKVVGGGGVGVARVWYDGGVWYVATSTDDSEGKKEKLLVFTGSVRCEDKITVEGKKLEPKGKTADTLTPHKDGKGFDFRFATYGAVDQAEFRIAEKGKTLKFKLMLDGEKMHPNRIAIGAESKTPAKEEFTLPAFPKEPEKEKEKK